MTKENKDTLATVAKVTPKVYPMTVARLITELQELVANAPIMASYRVMREDDTRTFPVRCFAVNVFHQEIELQ